MHSPSRFLSLRVVVVACLLLLTVGCAHFHQGRAEYGYYGSPDENKPEIESQVREQYNSGHPDSALILLREHTEAYGFREYQYRTRVMLEIANGTFTDRSYERPIITNILNYQTDQGRGRFNFSYWAPAVDRTFEPFMMRVAAEQAPKQPPGSVARLLCDCFSGPCDSLFSQLRTPRYASTNLNLYREAELRELRHNRLDGHFAIYSGMWWTQGNSRPLGNHPILGTVMGGTTHGFIYNVAAEGRFLNAPEQYIVKRGSKTDTTDSFIGWYTGFEFGRDLLRTGHHDIFSRVGAGVDGFAYSDPEGGKVKRKVNSFNFNVGVGYRYHLTAYGLNYIGLEGVYNIPFYDRKAGDHLDGQMISLRVLVGWYGNIDQGQWEKALLGKT